MRKAAVIISYLFHPIVIPLLGSILYFEISTRYHPQERVEHVLMSIFILSVLVPIILFFLLRKLYLVRGPFLSDVRERRIPLAMYIVLLSALLYRVIPRVFSEELYYFFAAYLGSMVGCYVLVLLRFKTSIHMIGIAAITFFVMGMSVHFQMQLIYLLSLLFFLNGALATSRLVLRAHNVPEMLVGFFLGAIPQLLAFMYWL